MSEKEMQKLINLPLDEATSIAKRLGFKIRILNKQDSVSTCEFCTDRINVELNDDNQVTAVLGLF